MKELSEAYLSSSIVYSLSRENKSAFKLGLLAYDRLIIPMLIKNIDWEEVQEHKHIFSSAAETKETCSTGWKKPHKSKDSEKSKITELCTYSLALNFFEGSKNAFDTLLKNNMITGIFDYQNVDVKSFMLDNITNQLKEGYTPIFHNGLYYYIYCYLSHCGLRDYDISNLKPEYVASIQDFFISAYLSKYHKVHTIFSTTDIFLHNVISKLPPLSSEDDYPRVVDAKWADGSFADYFPYDKVQDLVRLATETISPHDATRVMLEEYAPDILMIETADLIHAKKKDKFATLPKISEELSIRKDITKSDIVKYFNDNMWKLCRSILPSIKDVTFGILGCLPTKGINPISIASTYKALESRNYAIKNFGWIYLADDLCNQIEKKTVSKAPKYIENQDINQNLKKLLDLAAKNLLNNKYISFVPYGFTRRNIDKIKTKKVSEIDYDVEHFVQSLNDQVLFHPYETKNFRQAGFYQIGLTSDLHKKLEICNVYLDDQKNDIEYLVQKAKILEDISKKKALDAYKKIFKTGKSTSSEKLSTRRLSGYEYMNYGMFLIRINMFQKANNVFKYLIDTIPNTPGAKFYYCITAIASRRNIAICTLLDLLIEEWRLSKHKNEFVCLDIIMLSLFVGNFDLNNDYFDFIKESKTIDLNMNILHKHFLEKRKLDHIQIAFPLNGVVYLIQIARVDNP